MPVTSERSSAALKDHQLFCCRLTFTSARQHSHGEVQPAVNVFDWNPGAEVWG